MGNRGEKYAAGCCAWARGAALLVFLATPRPGAARAQEQQFEGQRVAAVRVFDENGREITAQRITLPLQAGQPFDFDAERRSLRALYLSGLYADIHTEAVPVTNGLEIDFLVRRNYFNNVVSITGISDDRLHSQALASMDMPLGITFLEAKVQQGLQHLKDVLVTEGYYQPHISYVLVPNERTRQMDVNVTVEIGPRARVGEILFENQTPYSNDELRKKSRLSSRNIISAARLERARDRIRKYLLSKDHLGARVNTDRGSYDPANNAVPITFVVVAGPRVRVTVEGVKYRRGQLKKLIPIFEEGSVDEDLLIEGRRNLRDDLQRQGYFNAQVAFTTRQDDQSGEQLINYTVDRGKKHRLAGISIQGNQYLGTPLLRERLVIHEGGRFSPGRFSEQLLQQDVASMKAIYQSNGFEQVKVETEEDQDYQGKENNLFVRFKVTEGPQTRVASLKFEGNRALSTENLLSVVGSTPGQPYSDANVSSDRDNVLAYYFNEGFPEAQFTAQVTAAKTPDRMDLTYKIDEGPQIRVNDVLLTGYQHTRPGVISRQVLVQAKEPLRQSEVIGTQRKLYNLGIFNRVVVAPQNPDGTDPDKDVVVEVEEAKRYTLGYGFGFEAQRLGGVSGSPAGTQFNASPLGIFEFSKNNVGGRGQTLGFQARASTLEYRALGSYNIPDFFARERFSMQLTVLAEKSEEVQTFTSRRYEGSLQVTQALTPFTSVLYRYTFRRVLVEASSLEIPTEEIPLFSQPTLLSGFGFTWLRDRRDNPADATKGSFNTVDLSQAARFLGSGAGYFKGFVQNSTYYPLAKSWVFARSARFGVEEPFAGTSNADIPLPERFFAGGGTSLRGFGLNQAGPRDPSTGFPIGGSAEIILNQELRFPLRLPYAGSKLGGTVFYDTGNVYSSLNKINLRWTSRSQHDLEYLSHTVGGGLRYNTPVGPVRLDFGYQLNPAKFAYYDPTNRFYRVSQLPHFEFFFSIGPVF